MQGDSAANVKDENALAPSVGADRLWNQLLKKHENVLMLICGHAWSQSYSGDLVMRRDQGEKGNTVYQIMANAQDIDDKRGGVGMLLMLRFSEDGNIIDFNWFSPVSGYSFRENNQFALDLNNEISIQGIEKDKTYCGAVSFTVTSGTTVTVKDGSKVLSPDANGVYTLNGRKGQRRITLVDPFGEVLSATILTVNEGHSGGEDTCTSCAVCEVCGEQYGELVPHNYGDDNRCTVCGAEGPQEAGGGCRVMIAASTAWLMLGAALAAATVTKKKR